MRVEDVVRTVFEEQRECGERRRAALPYAKHDEILCKVIGMQSCRFESAFPGTLL